MWSVYDYRFCTRASLQVMKEQRLKIYNDNINKNPDIYIGLHETDYELQNIYFQYYLTDWFYSHWNYMQDILDNHNSYTKDQKKQITLFFAKYFKDMLDGMKFSGSFSELIIPGLLERQKLILKELVLHTEKWEKYSNELKLIKKKNKENFENLISQYEKENKQ